LLGGFVIHWSFYSTIFGPAARKVIGPTVTIIIHQPIYSRCYNASILRTMFQLTSVVS